MSILPVASRLLIVAGLAAGLAACGSTAPTRPRPIASPAPSAEEALAAYRGQIADEEESSRGLNDAAAAEAVRGRVADIVPSAVAGEFELIMYINKAGEGSTAQHAFLYESSGSGFTHLDTWLVSTGREQQETSPKGASKFTTTPAGVFQFDVNHFVRLHKSNAWEADMPWAMFLRTRNGNPTTGIALHAALDKYVHNLGQRASAGCIRLLPSNAEKLYKLLQTKYAGTVPVTVSSGANVRMTGGRARGARALVIIEDMDSDKLLAKYGSYHTSSLQSH